MAKLPGAHSARQQFGVKNSTPAYTRMQPVIRPLWLLHTDEALRRSLALLPDQPYHLHSVDGWEQLRAALRQSPPSAIAVVDPFDPEGDTDGPCEELRDVLREFPSATLVAALCVTPEHSAVLATLSAWGVAEWIDLVGENTPAGVARRLRMVQSRPLQRLLARALPRGVPSRTQSLLLTAAEVVASGGQAPEFAAALGAALRTVPRWCERADLPPPQRLLAWLRLLLAADLLDDPSRSLEAIARATGYAGAPSLKTALRNLVESTPRALREHGAFDTVARRFELELFEKRESARAAGKPTRAWLQ